MPALVRCVGDSKSFLANSWRQRAHLHAETDIDGLLGVDEVDHIVSTMALRAPAFRLIRAGATLDVSSYTRRARIGSRTVTDLIDVGRVYSHYAEGATIVLQGLHRYWPPVAELCRALEEELTHPLQANAYITPPVAQGLNVHADAHDVFAIQTSGRKQWVVYEGDQQPGPDGAGATPTLDVQLEPGDCLYVPKGVHHAARTVDSASIHLTLGVKTLTWRDVLQTALDSAAGDRSLDDPLPPGFARDPALLADEADARLAGLAERIAAGDGHGAVQQAARRFWTGRMPALSGQLQQLRALDAIADTSTVRRRLHASARLTSGDGLVHLVLADRMLRLPAAAEPALRDVLARNEFCVADLREHLDEAGRRTLVRRLVREGLLVVVDD